MNKKILFLISLGISASPLMTFAQLHSYGPAISLSTLIPNIERVTWIIFGAVAVICFVIAGVMFLTAQGEPGKLQLARAAFLWGVAGVVVGIIAFSIIAIVGSFL